MFGHPAHGHLWTARQSKYGRNVALGRKLKKKKSQVSEKHSISRQIWMKATISQATCYFNSSHIPHPVIFLLHLPRYSVILGSCI